MFKKYRANSLNAQKTDAQTASDAAKTIGKGITAEIIKNCIPNTHSGDEWHHANKLISDGKPTKYYDTEAIAEIWAAHKSKKFNNLDCWESDEAEKISAKIDKFLAEKKKNKNIAEQIIGYIGVVTKRFYSLNWKTKSFQKEGEETYVGTITKKTEKFLTIKPFDSEEEVTSKDFKVTTFKTLKEYQKFLEKEKKEAEKRNKKVQKLEELERKKAQKVEKKYASLQAQQKFVRANKIVLCEINDKNDLPDNAWVAKNKSGKIIAYALMGNRPQKTLWNIEKHPFDWSFEYYRTFIKDELAKLGTVESIKIYF